MKKTAVICAIILYFTFFCDAETREPAVSGAFYPDNPIMLKANVDGFLKNAAVDNTKIPEGELIGFVAPHAGYLYSGPVAGYDYKLLDGRRYDTVIILGPNHRLPFFGKVSVGSKGNFKTPLGEVVIDEEFAGKIVNENTKKFVTDVNAQREEHSIEVQIPFLQEELKEFKIIPIMMGDYADETCRELAQAIYKNKGSKKILVIASSDLSHDMSYSKAVEMDKLGLKYIADLDIQGLAGAEAGNKTAMCGLGPIETLMYYVQPTRGVRGVVLKYANSGDTTGDKLGRIVGYGAVAFFAPIENGGDAVPVINKEGANMNSGQYSKDEKKALLKLARDTIANYLTAGKKDNPPLLSEKFKETRGVFVTLTELGELRGCIGYIEPIKPLQEAVIDNAVNAATEDPRFSRVNLKELPRIEIEISVLTPPEEVKSPEEFIVGKHGIIIKKGWSSAVFLPQVAPEQGWTREETLGHLCMKAGLPPDEWKKPGMKYYVFTAEVFNEKEMEKK